MNDRCSYVVVVIVTRVKKMERNNIIFFFVVVIVFTHNAARVQLLLLVCTLYRYTRTRLRDVNERFLRTISTTVYVRRKPTSFFCLTSSQNSHITSSSLSIKRLNGHDDDTTRSQYNVYINIYIIFQNKRNFNNHVWNWFLLPSSKAI